MIIYKCKMCGGDLEIQEGMGVCECMYCGTKQTLPKLNDDKRSNLYDRANHFRRNNEFDKAMTMYEQILAEDREDAEAYWSLVLCTYGVEYVEDPASHRKVPTVNRTQYTSVYMDENYKAALQYADDSQKQIYQEEAEQIDAIQKGILDISNKEEPYDVFICYKETDAQGERTPDSVLAQDMYFQLTQEGFKVFFARITLEDKLGSVYEPYIFAALNSAKVMIVVGTRAEYFNAVWVKNEWSRYLGLIRGGAKKVLIPAYKDMDPYDMPQEFSHLQAQDMGKLGFMQDLLRGVKKIVGVDKAQQSGADGETNKRESETAALIKRAFLFLEDGNFEKADELCEKVLNLDPENGEAYLGKLMIGLRVDRREKLAQLEKGIGKLDNYTKIMRFGSEALKAEVGGYQKQIIERLRRTKEENDARVYQDALDRLQRSKKSTDIELALSQLKTIADYKDAAERIKETEERLQRAVRAEKIWKIKLIAIAVASVVILIFVIKGVNAVSNMIDNHNQRKEIQANAETLLQEGQYEDSYILYHQIDKDSVWLKKMLDVVEDYLKSEEYAAAKEAFDCAGRHGTAELTNKMIKTLTKALDKSLENEEWDTAGLIIGWLNDQGEIPDKTEKNLVTTMERFLEDGEISSAGQFVGWLRIIGELDDAGDILTAAMEQSLENGEFDTTVQIVMLLQKGEFSEEVENILSSALERSLQNGKLETAKQLFVQLRRLGFSETAGELLTAATERLLSKGDMQTAELILGWANDSGSSESTGMQELVLEAKYDQADEYYAKAEYDSAYELFADLAGYRDSSDRMIDIRYKKVEQTIEKGELSEAEQMLEELVNDGYNDSTKWREHYLNAIYNMAAKYCETGDYMTGYDMFASLGNYNDAEAAKCEITGKRLSQLLRSTEVYGTVTFGRYEQDNDLSNGMEDVEWIVLDKQDDRCLLFSKYILYYTNEAEHGQWDNSSVREWMNSSFYETAFDSIEKDIILDSTLKIDELTRSSYFYDSEISAIDTNRTAQDKVFALTFSELRQYDPDTQYMVPDYIKTSPTVYANQSFIYESITRYSYLLRTEWNFNYFDTKMEPSYSLIAMVESTNSEYAGRWYEYAVWYNTEELFGIRPAIWVRMD